ncbi:amino acid adenylation domain-containing protein [Micromonospora sp. ATCC 39149]|uniref:AMP-binding protein n=1 Tax=Micromonospora carbonacea TaxID=47853 RepID=A0A7D6CD83_9ACTN|nr:AMP-binding protein [Micromonospora sp. ATCC 39149]EEP71447.1 amino acid adenylation domain-containing protein [Micromonospora sp. ATCC 39149]QLJ97710.1 AMP-binding protein [Micromonospora carbonacea]
MTAATLVELVARTVRDHPGRVALDFATTVVTYRELWELSGTIQGGIEPGVPVGLFVTRSPFSYAAYLAALRAGAPVVPLDPRDPPKRLHKMIRSAGVRLVLAEENGTHNLDGSGATQLDLSTARPGVRSGGPEPDTVALILFTSGSTGTPKGVPVTHRNAVAFLQHDIGRYEVTADSRLSHTVELTWDVSVLDIFAAWGTGAALVVPVGSELVAPVRYVRERRLSHWCSVPIAVSVARGRGTLQPGAMPGLRQSTFIGDQLTWQHAEAWQSAAPNSSIDNVYGPTELTVGCTFYRLPADPADWPTTSNGTVPIGQVYRHLDGLVLGADGRAAEEGELCVRGPQRFGGYLDAAHNAGRFLGPPAALTAEHWYRTGDRVRWEHGELVHLGRLDRQVQLGGRRVEPGEIEALLRGQATVEDAVVVVERDQRTLCAAYTGAPDATSALRRALSERLPPHMVPARFVWLPSLPLNANGKVDRGRLEAEVSR